MSRHKAEIAVKISETILEDIEEIYELEKKKAPKISFDELVETLLELGLATFKRRRT